MIVVRADSLYRVSAGGADCTLLRSPNKSKNEAALRWPAFLPDGRHFVYLVVMADAAQNEIRAGSIDSDEEKPLLLANSRALYAPDGYLLFVQEGTLMAQPFDPRRLEVSGKPVMIVEGIAYNPTSGNAAFGVSNNGTLVYRVADTSTLTELAWFDRTGSKIGVERSSGAFLHPRISPDERFIVVEKRERQTGDIWLIDRQRGTNSKFTTDPGDDSYPMFSPDGRSVAFTSFRNGSANLYIKDAGGVGEERLAFSSGFRSLGNLSLDAWHPGGKSVIFTFYRGQKSNDVSAVPISPEQDVTPILADKLDERFADVSPDGKWILYHSSDTGRSEMYVQTLPPSGRKWPISIDGSVFGQWTRNGREIVFQSPDNKLMTVEVTLEPNFKAGVPRELFEIPGTVAGDRWSVTANGQNFLLPLAPNATDRPSITVVLNWAADLKK